MARKTIYTREMILNSAIDIFKKDGYDAITAKNIAKNLNCSVAPIYSVYLSLEDLKKDLNKHIKKTLLNENEKKEEINSLLSKMLSKLEINENIDNEMSKKIKILKKNLEKKENRNSIFKNFTEIISLLSITRNSAYSRSKILSLIAKHRKYITEFIE